jgi:hypothetical protein
MGGRGVTLDTLRIFQEYHWLMLRVYHAVSVARFGEPGREAVRHGVRAAGRYRGLRMRDQAASLVHGRDAGRLIQHWDTGEWELAAIDGELEWAGSPAELCLTLPQAPGAAYLRQHDAADAVERYWPELLAGVAEGYDPRLVAHAAVGTATPWTLRLSFAGAAERPLASGLGLGLGLGEIERDPVRLLETARRTSGLIAALQMYVSRELVRRFDAAGEAAVREAAYQFGAERGGEVRRRHEATGTPITLASFASETGLQLRDPSEAVFVFAERQHVSDGAYYLDCTYCPLQEVWSHEGPEGLRLGYLFDAANHRGLFQSYHPETIVRWDSVKSRGDSVCRFRFTVPSLLTEDDPTPEQFNAG